MKCPHCKKVPYPARLDETKPLGKGNINWKNALRMDWFTILVVLLILFSAWGYKHDIAACEEVIEDPYGFCGGYCEAQARNQLYNEPFEGIIIGES